MKKSKRIKWIVLISIAVVLLFLIVWFLIPYSPLKSGFNKDVEELRTEKRLYGSDEVFTSQDFEGMPEAIQKYMVNCGYIGQRKMNSLKMEYQDVAFSQGRNGPKLSIDYTQYDYVAEPARLALIVSAK